MFGLFWPGGTVVTAAAIVIAFCGLKVGWEAVRAFGSAKYVTLGITSGVVLPLQTDGGFL